jgi:hypothetical protein
MFKVLITVCVLCLTMHGTLYAACSAETAKTKGSDVSDVLSTKPRKRNPMKHRK